MMTAAIAVFVLSIVLQGLFAGYETGFMSSSVIRMRHLAEDRKLYRAARMLRYMHHPDRMTTMLLIGTTVTLVAGTLALTHLFEGIPGREAVVLLAATPVFMIFSEFIPKTIFRTHPNRLILTFLPVIELFYWLAAVAVYPIASLTRLALRVIGHSHDYLSPFLSSLDDVRDLIDESADQGQIEPDEQRMIHSVIDLQHTRASEVMVPRIDIQALPESTTRKELLDLFNDSGRTRIPIYQDTIDTIVGVVNAYDVLVDESPGDASIQRFVRDVMHVPDSIEIDELFKEMKAAKQRMAIVVDEYGGTDGLITIEDILEEIFGEIQDESDREQRQIYQVAPRAYVVDARMALDDVSVFIGVELSDNDVDTIGGWVLHQAGRIPSQGEVVTAPGFRVTVLDGDSTRVTKIRLEIVKEPKPNRD